MGKSHTWIAIITMCPLYMMCNCIGALTLGNMGTGVKGSIYGPEMWDSAPFLTIFYFVLLALFQGFLFWCSAGIVDKVWPKTADEEFFQAAEGGDKDKKETLLAN